MKGKNKGVLLLLLLALFVSACSRGSASPEQEAESSAIHFIVLPDTQFSNAILLESEGHYGLIDASNPSRSDHEAFNYQHGNGTVVAEYLRRVGVEHLDFVIGTHAHSDHIGGIPELAESLNGAGGRFVDEQTAYIYKEYVVSRKDEVKASDEDSLSGAFVPEAGYFNAEYAERALAAMRDRHAILLDAGDPQSESWRAFGAIYRENAENPAGSTLSFPFGSGTLQLYNLFHASDRSENANSLVALFTCASGNALFTGDLDLYDRAEDLVMDAVAADTGGKITLLQAGHHGLSRSTSPETLKKIRPEHVVLMNANGTEQDEWKETSFYPFLAGRGGDIYGTLWANVALVFRMSDGSIMTCRDTDGALIPASPWKGNREGWYRWYESSDEYRWIYQDGQNRCYTGRKEIDGKSYLFDEDGLLLGWYSEAGGYGYLNPDGKKAEGWQTLCGETYCFIDGLAATGFRDIDGKTYYFDRHGCMQTGWRQIGDFWYRFNPESGAALKDQWVGKYYLKSDGTMAVDEWIGEYYVGADGAWVPDKSPD